MQFRSPPPLPKVLLSLLPLPPENTRLGLSGPSFGPKLARNWARALGSPLRNDHRFPFAWSNSPNRRFVFSATCRDARA